MTEPHFLQRKYRLTPLSAFCSPRNSGSSWRQLLPANYFHQRRELKARLKILANKLKVFCFPPRYQFHRKGRCRIPCWLFSYIIPERVAG